MIRFTTPLALVALLVPAAFLWLGPSWKRFLLRSLALVFIVLALADPQFATRQITQNVFLLVDRSASIGTSVSQARIHEEIERLTSQYPDWDFGIIEFAEDAVVASPLGAQPTLSPSLPFGLAKTRLGPAVDLAIASLPSGRNGQLVLISDGRFTDRIESAVNTAQYADIPIWVLPLNVERRSDVSVIAFRAPDEVLVGRPFEMNVELESPQAGSVTVAVYRGEELLSAEQIDLPAGRTARTIVDSLQRPGTYVYHVFAKREGDSISENDSLSTLVRTTHRPQLLLIQPPSSSAIPGLLDAIGISYEEADRVPPLDVLAEYRQLILTGFSLRELGPMEIANIETFVQDLGCGLLVVEGEYEVAGFSGGGIDGILPVSYTLPEKAQQASLAIVFLLDRSASMQSTAGGARKIDILKEATAASISLLAPETLVGIVAFNLEYGWIAPIEEVGDGTSVYNALRPLDAVGGTDLYYPIVAALDRLEPVEARSKHLLLVSDGKTTDEFRDYPSLLRRLEALDDVTFTAIAVGLAPNLPLLGKLVHSGGGELYLASDFAALPRISIEATQCISRSRFVTGSIDHITGHLQMMMAETPIPPLEGYVVIYPKATAQVLLWADEDPLVAHWRSGLGGVTVLNTDLGGRWSQGWVEWSHAPVLFESLLATTEPLTTSAVGLSVRIERKDEEIDVLVEARDGDEYVNFLQIEAELLPEGKIEPMSQVAPGVYRATFPLDAEGGYAVRAVDRSRSRSIFTTFSLPYPVEYREIGTDRTALRRIADQTGGKELTEGIGMTPMTDGSTSSSYPVFRELLLAALGLFLLDLFLRKVPRRTTARRRSSITSPD